VRSATKAKENSLRQRLRGSRFGRVLRLVFELVGILFFAAVVFLIWAFKTGRATDWARARIIVGLRNGCDVDASFDNITFDPFPPTIEITNLDLKHLDGRRLIHVEDAIATLQLFPLFMDRLQLDRVAVLEPKAEIELKHGRIRDLPRCVEPPERKPTSAPIVLGIRELTVNRGSFDLKIDDVFQATLDEFDVGLLPRTGSGGSNVSISVDHTNVRYQGRAFAIDTFRFLGHLEGLLTEPRAMLIDMLEVKMKDVDFGATGSIDLLGPVYDAALRLKAPLDAIHGFVADFPATEGALQLDFRLQGAAASPHGLGTLRLHDAKIDRFEIADDVTVDFAVDRNKAELSKIDARLAEGRVLGKGTIKFDGEHFPIQIQTDAEEISLGRVLDSLGIHGAWVDWRGSGKGSFSGSLLHPTEIRGGFDYHIRDFFVYDGAWDRPEVKGRKDPDPKNVLLNPHPIDVRGKWVWSEDGISFEEAEVKSGDTFGTAEAFLSFREKVGLRVHGDLPSFDFKDLGPIAQIKFGGHGHVVGGISGPYNWISGGGAVDFDDVTVTGIPFGHARAEVKWHDDFALDISDVKAKLGETDYSGSLGVLVRGEIPFKLRGTIGKGRIEDVLVPFGVKREEWGNPTGAVTGSFDLEGPITRLTGPIDLELSAGAILGEKFEGGRIHGHLDKGAIVADEALIDKHGAQLTGTARIDPFGGEVRARAHAKRLTLQKIDLMKAAEPYLDADLGLDLALSGNLSTVTGTVVAQAVRVTAGPLELQEGRIVGKIRGRTISLKGRLLGDALKVDGEVELSRGLPYKTTLELREYDVPKLVAALSGHLRYRGLAIGRARLSGSLIDWPLSSGEIVLDKGEIDVDDVHLETAAPATFTMVRGILDTKRIALVGPGTKLTAEGKLGAKLFDLKVVGKVNLEIARSLSPAIERVDGLLFLDSSIQGAPGNMNLIGTGRIDNGILKWRGFSVLTGVSADLTFSQSTVLIEKAEGRWADGRVSATGNLLLDGSRVKNLSLQVGVEDAYPSFAFPTVEVKGLLNGNVSMEGPLSRLLIRGDLDVTRGIVKPKIDIRSFVSRSRAGASVYDPSSEVLDLDIAFHAKTPVRMRNETVDTEAKGDLRLTGTNQRFGMLGSATVVGPGRVSLLREYEVVSGTIEFQDRYRFYPRYDIWVQAEACSARIRVNLVGTFDKFDTTYYSTPAMDETNILSCLIKGSRLQEYADPTADTRAATSPFFKLSGADREVRKVLPVDDIDIITDVSPVTRQLEPRVLVAKDLLLGGATARLEYSSSLARSEDRRFAFRYRINPQLTLQGSWVNKGVDQQLHPIGGDLGLDLKYRWEW
jgi:translocation-and-assembly-module (TAM) inner membrane subunit TamB-like protein